MASSFVHLHVHTEYSMLDGASRVEDLVGVVAADGQPAVGITDHGNMYGAVEMYKAARAAGVKPVLGTEAYLARGGSRLEKASGSGDNYHLTLLAENEAGYRNLMFVSSMAWVEGFSYKPRMDLGLLSEHAEGLVATTGCLGGHVPQLLLQDRFDDAVAAAGTYQDVFGRDSYFVELQDHGLDDDARVNPRLLEIARRIDAPLLATNDSHYTHSHDAEAHEILLCVQTGSLLSDPKRFKFESQQFWVKSAAEMRHLFRDHPEACDNTLLVAERCDVELRFGQNLLPHFEVPEGQTHASWLRREAQEGARRRYGDPLSEEVLRRLDYELGVIEEMGFPAYFLVVADYIGWAKDNGIRVGPGRGSAAGSLVSYCLGITELDPLAYGLIFERFLNPGRKQMPDIDVDFDERHRDRVIEYVAAKYGRDHVAQIITFASIKAKQSIRDAARVLDYQPKLADEVCKLFPPPEFGREATLDEALQKSKDLAQRVESDPDVGHIYENARKLEGLRRQEGVHAAAVVISRDPLTEHVPIAVTKTDDRAIITQFEMHAVEEIGLLKMDFLGLRNLSVIETTLVLLRARGVDLDVDAVPLDDPDTFELLRRADTMGVFQLEGGPMRALMRQLAPDRFEDLIALVSLYRPGPMGAGKHIEYAECKNGRRAVSYPHPDLEGVLAPTYGVICYQEQVMDVARRIAGYSAAEADDFRKAMGKKVRELVARQREKFIEGAVANGYERRLGEELFDLIEPFADYAFNKSHAACYAYVAYQTAYLKAHHPSEYMAALLTSVKDNKDRRPLYLTETRAMGVAVLPPDVNASRSDFSVREDGAIPFGLSAIRNVGAGVVEAIVREREKQGPFEDFFDFLRRVDPMVLNKRTVESLVKAGAFDSMGHPRRALFDVHETAIDLVLEKRRQEDAGQFSLFDGGDDPGAGSVVDLPRVGEEEWDRLTRLRFEKEMLGMYVSDHPLQGVERALRRHVEITVGEILERRPERDVKWLGGVVVSQDRRTTKRGDTILILQFEDFTGGVEAVVYQSVMNRSGVSIENDVAFLLKCQISTRDEDVRVVVLEIKRPDLSEEERPVRLQVHAGRVTEGLLDDLSRVLRSHPGQTPVFLHLRTDRGVTVCRLGDHLMVQSRSGLFAELKTVLGPAALVAE